MSPQDLLYGTVSRFIPFQFHYKSRPVRIFSWHIYNVSISRSCRQFFPHQIMIAIGIVCQFNNASETVLFVIMQGRCFFFMYFLDLCSNCFFIALQCIDKQLITFLQPSYGFGMLYFPYRFLELKFNLFIGYMHRFRRCIIG